MRIICQQCNKTTLGSLREKRYTAGGKLWIQKVCDTCGYVADEWEGPSDALLDRLGVEFSESEKLAQVFQEEMA
jgi:hypothetical protein